MPKIEFLPSKKTLNVEAGTELIDAARMAGVEIESPCGGKGTCGKCLIRVAQGEMENQSTASLTPQAVAEGYVQSCRARLGIGDVVVEIDESSWGKSGKFISEDETHMVSYELMPIPDQLDPRTDMLLVHVAAPASGDGLSDVDRLIRAIQNEVGISKIDVTLRTARKVANAIRAENGLVTVAIEQGDEQAKVIAIDPGDRTHEHYGIAVDIGTTTVVVQVVDLKSARIIATRGNYNGQVACGSDIISRINYAQKPERLEELSSRVLETINNLLGAAAKSKNIDPSRISNASISGNTTMIHLMLGLSPEHIRLDPYTPTVLKTGPYAAGEVGVKINPDARISISPNVGSYVGGDITSGLLCTDFQKNVKDINLFIDIGTNGEIVVGNDEFLMGCACSAGPAFEGGGVKCGTRAATGAIETVEVDKQTGLPSYVTIGDIPPRGICGSGMISLLANLFLTGWIDPAGKLCRDRESSAIRIQGRRASYVIASADESSTSQEIIIDEIDIENIIRAKAAIYSACSLVLTEVETSFDSLANIYIAGGFGRSLSLDKAIVIGLLPDVPRNKFHFLGNASLIGSYMALVSSKFDRQRDELASRMTYIDLSTNPTYMDQYTAALFLPHTDLKRFPTANMLS
ncbi:MAG: DUF4445 domain-containing protein [Proteobacteria bacterium]|nr:DUF4445 domain-containing protein [Pseudomonadota bacterium]